MATFNFYIDKKQTIWQREYHELEANSREELIERLKEITKNCDDDPDEFDNELNSFQEQEILFDTFDYMSVAENGGNSTIEVYLDDNKYSVPELIATNGTV